jgi:hypothetical protein
MTKVAGYPTKLVPYEGTVVSLGRGGGSFAKIEPDPAKIVLLIECEHGARWSCVLRQTRTLQAAMLAVTVSRLRECRDCRGAAS